MRRQYFYWIYLVAAIVLTIYGGYSIIYNVTHEKSAPILGIVFLAIGGLMLVVYLALFIISLFQKKKETPIVEPTKEKVEEKIEEPQIAEKKPAKTASFDRNYSSEVSYESSRSSGSRAFVGGSGYVKLVGRGPVLRIEEEEILDMRSNTYYVIEGNMVKMRGQGPIYEISGSRIRDAFGGYLYEISGSSVNKTFGGFFASIESGYLQTHDLKVKYEIPSSLNMKQKLAIVALLFGSY